MNAKKKNYDALVVDRKKCRLCVGLSNPSANLLSQYDSAEIGPWTRLHGDLNAKLMIIGQDWGDVDYYIKNQGLDKLTNPTMQNLEQILNHIEIEISVTTYSEHHRDLFLTNAILCLKTGGMQAKVNPLWVENCSKQFLRQQIEIVRPKVIVGLGLFAFQSVLRAFKLPRASFKT